MNVKNAMNVNSVRRPRRLPGARSGLTQAQPLSRGSHRSSHSGGNSGGSSGRGLTRNHRCLDGRGKQAARPVPAPEYRDQNQATAAGERRKT